MNDAPTPTVRLEESRERTIDALCRHFAVDHLSIDEFERRVDAAHRARGAAELDELLRDLPVPAGAATAAGVAPAPPPAPVDRPDRGYAIAILGGATRKGRWIPAQRTLVYTVMGGATLDFREALLPPGITEIAVFALMGGVEIIVPPGLAVESGGIAIMGGFDHSHDDPGHRAPDAPTLRIRGFALMGGVDVKTRLPGESERDARRREREERRRLRSERRRALHGG